MSGRAKAYFLPLLAGIVFSGAVRGQDTLQQKLAKHFVISKVANDGSIINAGSSLVLHKDGLVTYTISSPQPPLNTWKDNKLSLSFTRNMAIGVAVGGNGVADLPKRKFVSGELLWLIGIIMEKDAVVFRLLSDPYDGVRYYGDLKFPFPKGGQPTAEQAAHGINEVISVQEPEKPATEAPAPAPARTVARPPVPAPVAPPVAPPVETQTVSLGDTPERVIAALGQPRNIVKLPTKQIYIYPNLKVTFENGKVTDVQ